MLLTQTNLVIPTSILMKIIKLLENNTKIVNEYLFIEFKSPEEIEFFQFLDCIIDYDAAKSIPLSEIAILEQNISKERNTIVEKFNSMQLEERKNNIDMISQCRLLEIKMDSLKRFLN